MLETVLATEPLFRARPWFLSDQFSLLDAAVAPILWRLPHWRINPRRAHRPRALPAARVRPPALRSSLSEAERDMRP